MPNRHQGDRTVAIPAPTTFRAPDTNTRVRFTGTTYNPRTARLICERLMMGESIAKVCEDPRMPSKRTVFRWLSDPKCVDFREMYYYSRRVAVEALVDEIIEIADNTDKDWEPVFNKQGELVDLKPNNEAIQRSRVRIDTRKWLAAKLVPRIYGDNTQVELGVTGDLAELLKKATNKDDGLPPPIEHES